MTSRLGSPRRGPSVTEEGRFSGEAGRESRLFVFRPRRDQSFKFSFSLQLHRLLTLLRRRRVFMMAGVQPEDGWTTASEVKDATFHDVTCGWMKNPVSQGREVRMNKLQCHVTFHLSL